MTPDAGFEDSLFGIVLQDSYKITGLLGEGGMGAVYDALQIRLNKRVAIKVMARELARNAEALNRFHREAMITSGLGHPHIVQVFDFATTPTGQPFLAMEFLDGEDLDNRLSRVGRLSPEQTSHIVKQVASALAATHAQQIVHRDLKPANIYLLKVAGEDDFVKVLDFGISKIRAANTKITKASALIGTPDYMSPEQAMGGSDDVDDRTDQWALACIAWECLSGRGPFAGDTIPSMLFQVVHGEPPALSTKVEGLPAGIEPVLRKALSKKKEDRFANVVEFAQALENAVVVKPESQAVVQAVADTPASQSQRVVRTARAITHSGTAVYGSAPDPERSEKPTTTFSHSVGETRGDEQPRPRPKWQWAAVGAGAVALSLIVAVAARSSSHKKAAPAMSAAPAPDQPAAITPPAPAPIPVPAPAAAAPPAPVAAPAPTAAEPVPAVPEATKAAATAPAEDATKTTGADEKPRVRKSGSAAHSKAKTPLPEHRIIKEL
jgi:serine/threonine protein kinase